MACQRRKKCLKFHAVSLSIPHPAKEYKQGEDASFVTPRGLGVFDGVGGWSEMGIDSGQYSKHLASLTKEAIDARPSKQITAHDALSHALRNAEEAGSSTMCAATIQNGNQLHVCNVGDCGIILVRDGTEVFASEEQQHVFNQPYQVSFEDRWDFDYADVHELALCEGDVILMASDGVWDNLDKSEAVGITSTHVSEWRQQRSAEGKTCIPRGKNPVHIEVPKRNCAARKGKSETIRSTRSLSRSSRMSCSGSSSVTGSRTSSSSSSSSTSSGCTGSERGEACEVIAHAMRVMKRQCGNDTLRTPELLKPLLLELGRRTCETAYSQTADSPFAQKARLEGEDLDGGKLDDITLVVAMVVQSDNLYHAVYQGQCSLECYQ